MKPYFEVGEIAIVVGTVMNHYNNTECTIVGTLRERPGFRPSDPLRQVRRSLSYEIRTSDEQLWLVHPSCLRKKYQPGKPWSVLRDELNRRWARIGSEA